MILECSIAFILAVLYNCGRLLWVHYSERGNATAVAILSGIGAVVWLTGIVDGAVLSYNVALCLVLGYSCGGYITVKIKDRLNGNRRRHHV